ncbi:MAG: 30S ribosomal protein S6 [Planctomycetota bacterium]
MTERLYEGLFLLDANETARDWPAMESHLKGLLTKHQASIEYAERWPDQRLAYDVKGCRKGTYYLTYFRADTQSLAQLRRDSELSERILRCLFVHEDWLETEMNKRKEAAHRRSSAPQGAPAPERPRFQPVDDSEEGADEPSWSDRDPRHDD